MVSCFLRNAMPPKFPFQTGSQVEHPKFGLGSVVSINEERLTVKYDEHGEKTFVTSIALPQLKKSDREPPAEKRSKRKSPTSSTAKKSTKKKAKSEAAAPEAE